MKLKLLYSTFTIFLFSILFVSIVQAQIEIPEASPRCTLVQKVGLTEITVDYGRPSMRNRLIFGEIVPYDRMWRTGQNEATTITFSDDVLVEGEFLPKGKYALYSIPGEDEWDIIFYKDWDHFGLPKRYVDDDEVLRVTVFSDVLAATFETFLINFDKLTSSSAMLQLFWEDVIVEINLEFDTDLKVKEQIEKVMAGPARSDYYLAAKYYYDHDIDLESALDWVNMANEKGEKYWQYRLKSLILNKLDDPEFALLAAKKSLEMSKKARNNKYVQYNEALIDELLSKNPSLKTQDATNPKSEIKPVERKMSRDEQLLDEDN